MELSAVPQQRRIEVETVFGTVEGFIRCSSSIRTLDDLNFPRADYLVILEPTGSGVDSPLSGAGGPLAIQKESVLFLREMPAVVRSSPRANAEKCWVSVVEYRVGPFSLRGTVHYPPNSEPIARLNLRTHQFLALTSVLVTGPGRTFEAPFIAVNRQHLLSAREIDGVAEATTVAADHQASGAEAG